MSESIITVKRRCLGMTRAEALRIGKIIADRRYKHNKPLIQSRQNIGRMKKWLSTDGM